MSARIKILMIACLTLAGVAQGQRAFNLQINTTNAHLQISWPSQSAVPAGGTQLFPQYVLLRSSDLENWSKVFVDNGAAGKTFRFVDDTAGPSFYRVQSKIAQSYAELPQANFNNGELTGADFFGADLFGATATFAKMDHATFIGADLSFVDFTDADMTGSDLFAVNALSANLQGTSLQGADLSFGNFSSAELLAIDLTGADLSSCNFIGADLRWASFHSTITNADTILAPQFSRIRDIVIDGGAGAILTNADLSFADFHNVNFSNANFSRSSVFATFFSSCDLRGANFTLADTRFIFLDHTILDATTTIDAKSRLVWQIVNNGVVGQNLRATNLSSVSLIEADLRSAILTNVNFSSSILLKANVGNANLRLANCAGADLTRAVLTNANLSNVSFQNAILTQANLRSAITNGAIFTGAVFNQTIMPDGTIRNQ